MTIDAILDRQAGVISREQALEAGLTRDAVDHRIRVRRWRPLYPRIYLATPGRPADEVRVRAAMLWAGPDAVLCAAAAAWWHGLIAGPPETIAITVSRRCPASRHGVSVRRRCLPEPDVTERRGIAVTARPLALLEAAVELGVQGVELLDRCLRTTIPLPDVQAALRRGGGSAAAGWALTAATARLAASRGDVISTTSTSRHVPLGRPLDRNPGVTADTPAACR
jgi:hypothetical protein